MKYIVIAEDRIPGVHLYMSYCDQHSIRYDENITGAMGFDTLTTARDAIGQASDFRNKTTYTTITMTDKDFFNMKLRGKL